jgi:N-acetylmuramoyl-L-alanine amidase
MVGIRRWIGLGQLAIVALGAVARVAPAQLPRPTSAEAAPLPPLAVRYGDRARSVPTVRHADGSTAVRADALAAALGGQTVADRRRGRRLRVEVGTLGIDVESGSALAVVGEDTVALSAEVFRQAGVWYVPLTLATDLLPRSGVGVLFDEEQREVRRFGTVAATRRPRPPAPTVASGRREPTRAPMREPMSGPDEPPAGVRRGVNRQRIVVIDAGHGGPDRGMSGPLGAPTKIYEKDVTLAISKVLKRALEARGVTVVMTRTTDTLINLYDRGPIANKAQGDLFVSIHVNAANPKWNNPGAARGFETYFLSEAKTEDERRVEAMENEAIRFETTVDASRNDPLSFIIRDMAQNEHLRESAELARQIQGSMKAVHPGPSRGVKQAGLVVLVTSFMPSVLVEVGFGSNRADAEFITSPAQQERLSASIADAIIRYLAGYDRKVGGS